MGADDVIGFFGVILFFGCLGFGIIAIFMFIGTNWSTGGGVSTDFVMGVESSGIFWKTSDVYLRNEHPTSTNAGRYCLPPELVVTESDKLLSDAAKNNTKCTLYYESKLAVYPWRCNEGKAIITKVSCE